MQTGARSNRIAASPLTLARIDFSVSDSNPMM